MSINIGDLNKRVAVQSLSQVEDGSGGFEDALTTIKTVWASINPLSGREKWQAQQAQAELSHKIVVRYTQDINRSHVLSYKNRLFDIQYINNINEEDRFLELTVLERQQCQA